MQIQKPWRHRSKPSEHYLGAILRAYDKASEEDGDVTASKLWDYIVTECLHTPHGFDTMFYWDSRKSVNRVGDILEVIQAGLAPGLYVEQQGTKLFIRSE